MPGDIEVMNKKPFFPFEIKQYGTEKIIGRQLDIQAIVELIKQKNRIVVVQGLVGIGKSAVIKKVGKFFYDRESFKDGVIYFSMRDRQFVNILVFKMHSFITKHKTDDDDIGLDLNKSISSTTSSSKPLSSQKSFIDLKEKGNDHSFELPNPFQDLKQLMDKEKIHQICQCLRQRECLVIVDNTEDVLRSDEEQFSKFFEILLNKCPDIQLLISSNEHLQHKIPETKFYKLGPLSNKHSLELLELKSGHEISPQDIRELLQKTQTNKNNNEYKPKINRLQDHHLCTILGGHQGAITLLAPLFKNRSLFEFYKTLIKMFADPGLLQDISHGSIHTLQISLTATTKHLQKTNPMAVQLFSLVGLLPGGVYEKDLTMIWGSEKWILLAEVLMQASLMNVKNENTHGETLGRRKYILLQFMNKFAESLLSQSKLKEFHEHICDELQARVNYYFNSCCVENARNKQTQHQMEIVEYEVNIWACIYRILDFHTPKDDQQKLIQKINRNHLHHQTGYSSTEDNHLVVVKGNVEITDVSDTCDDHHFRDEYRDDTSFTPTLTANNNSISPSITEKKPSSRDHSKSGTERKMSSCEKKQEQQIQSSLCLSCLATEHKNLSPKEKVKIKYQSKKDIKNKQSTKKNPPPVESRIRLASHDETFSAFPMKQSFSIEKRVSLQLAQIEKTQQKLIKSLPQENLQNFTQHKAAVINEGTDRALSSQVVPNQELIQQNAFSDISEQVNENESQVDSIKAENQFEIEHSFSKDETSYAPAPRDNPTDMSFQNWTVCSACFHIEDIFCRSHSICEIENSKIQDRTYATMQNPQDNPDCFDPQTEENQTQKEEIKENFLDEFLRQNLTYLKESENELTPRVAFSHDNLVSNRECETQVFSAAESQEGVKFTSNNKSNQSSQSRKNSRSETPKSKYKGSTRTKAQQKAQKQQMPHQVDSSEPQSSSKEEDGVQVSKKNYSSIKWPDQAINPACGFVPKSQGLTISINNENQSSDWKRNKIEKQAGLSMPLTSIEERYFKEMTNEQKLIVTYISLLVLSHRSSFALRAISLIDQHLKNKLVCHANLTKLYGLCILKSKQERIKDAFELFRRAKHIFKMVGGENNNYNMGVAQCYMIQGILLRTKSEQLFAPKQPQESVVLKKALKRFEAAKQIYKERQHLAGQLFCCTELLHVYKSLKIRYLHLSNEHRELVANLRGAYTEDSRLVCGSGQNTHVFIQRNEGVELSLMIEIIDYHQIVNTQLSKARKVNTKRVNTRNQLQQKSLKLENQYKVPPQQTQKPLTPAYAKPRLAINAVYKNSGKADQFNKKNFKPAKIGRSNSEENLTGKEESKNEYEESQSEVKASGPKKPTNRALQLKAEKEFKQIKQKIQTQTSAKNKNLKQFQSLEHEQLNIIGTAVTISTEFAVEKPRKTNKYAHIHPKVDTFRRNIDQNSTTQKDASTDHHSSEEELKQSMLSDNVSLTAPVVDAEDS